MTTLSELVKDNRKEIGRAWLSVVTQHPDVPKDSQEFLTLLTQEIKKPVWDRYKYDTFRCRNPEGIYWDNGGFHLSPTLPVES